jgi:hypothetical protein
MTDNNLSFTMEDLFQQVVARGIEHRVTDQASYNDLVEELIEERRSVGEIHTDNPTEDMEAQLRGRWVDYQASLEDRFKNIDSL